MMATLLARSFCVALIGLLLLARDGLAQLDTRPRLSPNVIVEEVDQLTLSQLERASKFFEEKQHADAVETLRRAIDQQGDRLFGAASKESPTEFTTLAPLRDEAMRRLGNMIAQSPEVERLYRGQVDAEVKSQLERARQTRDDAALTRITQQYLASSFGDDAALLLGDAALSRGDVIAARRAWLTLHPALRTSEQAAQKLGIYPGLPWYWALRGTSPRFGESGNQELFTDTTVEPILATHPKSEIPLAKVRARLVVASVLESNLRRAQWELEVFKSVHVEERGTLGGKTGLYADLLTQAIQAAGSWPASGPDGNWSTFARFEERNAHAPGNVDVAGQPLWSIPLDRLTGGRDLVGAGRLRVAEDQEGVLSYHPIVYQNLVIVGNAHSLRAFELASGQLAWEVQLRNAGVDSLTNQQVGVPRYTLSAAEGVVAATLPSPVVPVRRAATVRREDLSRIVAVDLQTRKLVFDVYADDASMVFEGTPILHRGRVYVALRKQGEIQPQSFVACYDLATGRQLWQRFVCSSASLGEGKLSEFANSLLTLSHDTLYFNSNLGVIAAIAAEDGSLRWVTKYPRATFPTQKAERTDRHFFRDLTPCVVHQGQVFCAPSDCERIFSLDATSGQLIWTLPPNDAADAVHLLGVSGDHLLASGDYLYWIDVVRGQVVTQFPAALPVGPGLALPTPRGWGRGALAGDEVWWPTQTVLYVFGTSPERQEAFYRAKKIREVDLQLRGVSGGNVVLADKHLVLATADKLLVFGE